MTDFPDDIFTEPEDVDPDTLANLGPLARLAGVWEGRKGVDINPKADGPERRVYQERIVMEPIDPQANGPQLLRGLRYHLHVNTEEEDITFHDQVGYWLWEPATGLVMQSLTIPRGQCVLAGGAAKEDGTGLTVRDIEVDGQPIDWQSGHIIDGGPLLDTWLYRVHLTRTGEPPLTGRRP